MAFLEDKIDEIRDPELRRIILQEVKKLKSEKKFGLVFEEHLPELAPIYNAPIRPGDTVAQKNGALTDTYAVTGLNGYNASLIKDADGSAYQMFVNELVVVKRFGEAVYPALTPLDQVATDPAAPTHTLIEADNYHALQLLEYTYAGQVDVIYIDPPYNTGARDWKYNNRYVDDNDSWRHSKWLSMMRKRLLLAKRLLNPNFGALIVTIDEKEYLRLGLLLEELFTGCNIQMVSTMINPANVARAGAFGRSDEYIFFVMVGEAAPQRIRLNREWVSDKGRTHTGNIRWDMLRRSGTNTSRNHSPGCFYPIYVNPDGPHVEKVGDPLPKGQSSPDEIPGLVSVLPIRKDGSEGNWQWAPDTFQERLHQGRVRITGSAEKGFVVSILKDGEFAKIERREFLEIGRNPDGSIIVEDVDTKFVLAVPGSQWKISTHDATQYGSRLLADIIPGRRFPFPKSVYAVRDALRFFVDDRPNALILDFFAGSGTTLHATLLLNAADGGRRRCILVTNNEVAEEEARRLAGQGHQPNDPAWEAQGICRSVTFPRCKYVIRGRRDDGTELAGEYLTGRTVSKEKPRIFRQLSFIDPAALSSAAGKREVVSLTEGIPQTEIKAETAFFVSEKHSATILFDERQAQAWLAALEDQEHISHFYLITPDAKTFAGLKQAITALLGPLEVADEEKRPMQAGFKANLEYFKLEFLDPHEVQLGQQFRAILPILWLMAGASGPRPQASGQEPYLIPAANPLAVLLDETQFRPFKAEVDARPDLSHIFLVTDSEDAFFDMKSELNAPHIIMLYKNYLQNFKINTQRP